MRTSITVTRLTVVAKDIVEVAFVRKEGDRETTLQWVSEEAVRAIAAASPFSKQTKMPATATLGGDQLHDVEIDWSQEFEWRQELLAAWVMVI